MPAYRDDSRKTWMAMLSYIDASGEKKRKAKRGFKTKAEALEWERNFLSLHTKDINVTLDVFYEMYISDLKARIRYNTLRGKISMYKHHVSPYLGKKEVNKILPIDIITWQNKMISNGFSNTYLRTLSNQIFALFNHAERYYDLKANPLKKINPIGSKKGVNVNFWTKEEFDKFLSAVDDESAFIHFTMLFYTGMRISELIALKLEDINLEKRIISFNKAAQYEQGKYIFTETKTPKSNRQITIPQFLADLLKEFIGKYYFIDPDEQVFMTNKSRMSKELKRYALAAGVKIIRIHDLRHSHASFLIDQCVDPVLIQARLGHEKIETTISIYGHLYPNKQMKIADYMDEIIKVSSTPQLSSCRQLVL